MIIQSQKETVVNIFTSLPENVDFPDALLWIGTAMLVVWLLGLTVSVKAARLRSGIVILLSAGVLGFAGYILYQNINENLGGYYLKGRIADDLLLPEIDADPGSPGRDYLVYFPGAVRGKRFKSDIVKTDTCAVLPHGYNAAVRRFAARLRPQDRLHLVGFSRGGGEALAAAQEIRRPIASLVLADPTADLLQAVECRINPCRKPRNVEFFKVFTVHDYDAVTDSNESIRKYLFFMMARHIDRRYVEVLDSDHGMWTTGYRVNERDRAEVEKLRSRVIADHDRACPADRAEPVGSGKKVPCAD